MERLRVADMAVRRRVVASLRRRAVAAFQAPRTSGKRDPFEALSTDSRRLTQLEKSLQDAGSLAARAQAGAAAAARAGVRQAGAVHHALRAHRAVRPRHSDGGGEPAAGGPGDRDRPRRVPGDAWRPRLVEHARSLARDVASPPPAPSAVVNGDAYSFYRNSFSVRAPDGELAALMGLDTSWPSPGPRRRPRSCRTRCGRRWRRRSWSSSTRASSTCAAG